MIIPTRFQPNKNTQIIDTVEKNYKISRRIYQSLFVDADSFIEFIHSLDVDEIQELYDDLKGNGWGVRSLLEIENAYELLTAFQMICYLNGILSLRNGLLIVPDEKVPEGTEKINLKILYQMLKDTSSHGLVSIQFLSALGIFFGLDISTPKNAATELYRNLSYESLSGVGDHEFQAISDLVGDMSFQIKNSTLSNTKRKEKQDKKCSNLKIRDERDFFEKPDQFMEELKEDLICSRTSNINTPTLNHIFRTQKQYRLKLKRKMKNLKIFLQNIKK